MDSSCRPKLRPLDASIQEVDGEPAVVLRDPEGISEHVAALPPRLAEFLFASLDGTRTVTEIERHVGPGVDLRGILEQLDEALFLESPRYGERRAAILTEYRSTRLRPVGMAESYPENLPAFLDDLYEGRPASRAKTPLAAIAIPHLDLRFGGRAAARALAGLGARMPGDTVVVLGVGHQLARYPYALTRKDFETPLGTVPLADDLYDRVVGKAGSWVEKEELLHRGEHSVEFAALLLRHAMPNREFRILPVLCGSFHPFLATGRDPLADPLVSAFVEALAEEAPDALLLASVDLDHRGPNYGDPEPLGEADLAALREQDKELTALLAGRDSAGFFAHLAAGGPDRRVCGASALYTLLSLLPPGPKGKLLAYEQPVFPEPGNTVSICSMAWRR